MRILILRAHRRPGKLRRGKGIYDSVNVVYSYWARQRILLRRINRGGVILREAIGKRSK